MIDKPEQTPATAHPATKYAAKKNRKANLAVFLSFLALFFTAAGIAAGYKHWQRTHERAKNNRANIAILQDSLAARTSRSALQGLYQKVTNTAAGIEQRADERLESIEKIQYQIQQYVDVIDQQVTQITQLQEQLQQRTSTTIASTANRNWQLAEVRYLLRLADREMRLTHNLDAAITALEQADRRLGEMGETHYLPVRQQITADLAELKSLINSDTFLLPKQLLKKLAIQIHALTSNQLPPSTQTQVGRQGASPASATDNTPFWKNYTASALQTLSQAVIIRKNEQPISAQLDLLTRQQLQQLLQLRLEILYLLVLRQDNQLYHQQLDLLKQTIDTYYSHQKAEPLLQSLNKLDKINLKPDLPEILLSLEKLNSIHQTAANTTDE